MTSKILIVEDDDLIREIYTLRLELAGFEVAIAKDGEEGLKQAERSQPDVIVLDMLMPKLDGLGFLRRYRPNAKLGRAPVIVASNNSATETVQMAKQLGASEYLIKSQVTPDDILQCINKYLPEAAA